MQIIRRLLLIGTLLLAAGCQLPDSVDYEFRSVIVKDSTDHPHPLDSALEEFTSQGWIVVRFDPNPDNPQDEWKVVLKRPKK